jgi:PPE-repeat protein
VSAGLRVDSASLRAAGSQAAGISAHPAMIGVGPCAGDAVSTGVAAQLSEQMRLSASYIEAADATAHQFGALLGANAASYEAQERDSATALGAVGTAHVDPTPLPAMPAPATKDLAPPWTVRPGEPPSSPRHIAELVHIGPGSAPMRAAASGLRSDAGRLESAADQLAATASQARDSWTSDSADLATGRIGDLHTWYLGHAQHVRGLAADLDAHAEQFEQARAAVPTPQQIDRAERELRTAADANMRSNGRLAPAVSQAQANLGRVYQAAVSGYSGYTVATGAVTPRVPAPPPAPPAGSMQQPAQQQTGGDGPPAKQRHHGPVTDPVKPVEAGTGTDEVSGGPTWPAGDVPSAPVRPPVPDPNPPVGPDPVVDPISEAAPSIMPAIIGSVVGGLGGGLGGLAGAAPRMLGGLGSAAPAALSGLGNPMGGLPSAEQSGGEPQTPETPGGLGAPHVPESPSGGIDPDHSGGIGGGGSGGGTEPSGVAGPLAPAAGIASTPEVAAPVAAPVSAIPAAAETAEGGSGFGGMMPPFFPPGRSGGGISEADRKLYPRRRLKVVAPPNSEPVLHRREGRQKPAEETRNEGAQP